MATYRYKRQEYWDGYQEFVIEKKSFFSWKPIKTWEIGFSYEFINDRFVYNQKQEMLKSVKHLREAGHTVI